MDAALVDENQHLDLGEVRAQARTLAEERRKARQDFTTQSQIENQAEHDYRVLKATAFTQHRINGESTEGAKVLAEGEAAVHRLRRDQAHTLAKAAEQRMEELERNGATLNRIAEWSMKLEGLPQPQWSGNRGAS